MEEAHERFLRRLWPLLSEVYAYVEGGVQDSFLYFEQRSTHIDPWLFSHQVRRHVCDKLDELMPSGVGFFRVPQPLSGVEIKYQRKTIKVFKADDGHIPAPGQSRRRREFYNKNLYGSDVEVFDLISWTVVWDVDVAYNLNRIQLICPKATTNIWKPGSQRLAIDLPHPAEVDWLQESLDEAEIDDPNLEEFDEDRQDLDIAKAVGIDEDETE